MPRLISNIDAQNEGRNTLKAVRYGHGIVAECWSLLGATIVALPASIAAFSAAVLTAALQITEGVGRSRRHA